MSNTLTFWNAHIKTKPRLKSQGFVSSLRRAMGAPFHCRLSLPGDSVLQAPGCCSLAVLEHHAHLRQLVANTVGLGPVLLRAGLQTGLDQRLNLSRINPPGRTGLQ